MKLLFMAALMVVMSATPSLACEGLCPMGLQMKNQTTSPCPHHSKSTEAKPTCDGLMLLADCVDLSMANTDTPTPNTVTTNGHPNGDTPTAIALLPENSIAAFTKTRAPPQTFAAVHSPFLPVFLSTQRLRL